MSNVRIVPTFAGYEVWCDDVIVDTPRSKLAAVELKRYLEGLRDVPSTAYSVEEA